jgi:NADH-quinone oxidoreductase subunit I
MKSPFSEIYGGVKSLFIGMRITLGQFFKPIVTVQYPHAALKIPPRFRGHIELVRDPSTGKAICFACKLCERACPSDCITVEGAKLDGAKKRSVTSYRLDFTKCSLCGSCVEACRDGAIRFSREYNLASVSKEDYIMDLMKRLEAEAREAGEPTAAPATLEPNPKSDTRSPGGRPPTPDTNSKLEGPRLEAGAGNSGIPKSEIVSPKSEAPALKGEAK